jgi:hypothetical protein
MHSYRTVGWARWARPGLRNTQRKGASMTMKSTAVALLITCSATAFAQSTAPAQDVPWQMMGGSGMTGMMMPGGTMGGCSMMGAAAHAEGRIAFLKAELAITDQQKDAWEAYAASIKKNLQGMQGMRETMIKVMQAKSPVERLDAQIAAMDGRLSALKELKPVLASLYNALSEDQRKQADDLLTGMGCMM